MTGKVLKLSVLLSLLLVVGVGAALAQETTPTPDDDEGRRLRFGETAEGELTTAAPDAVYTFVGEVGQFVVIELVSSDFDSYLRLLGPGGEEIATDDDGAGSLNARIGPLTLTQNGRFSVIASSLGGSDTGFYRLSLSTARPQTLAYGDQVEDRLTDEARMRVYRFSGESGDVISLGMSSADFDAYLRLLPSTGGGTTVDLAYDDDSGAGLDARIGPLTLPETGDYLVIAQPRSEATGAFTITLDRVRVRRLTFGQRAEAAISDEQRVLYYQFEGDSGDVVNLRIEDATLDTTLTVLDPLQSEIRYDDDSGSGDNPEISQIILTTAGTYTVIVQPYSTGDTGSLMLALERSELPSLDEETQRVRLSEKQPSAVLKFNAAAGQRYRLTVDIVPGRGNAPYIAVTQNGETVASAQAGSANVLSFVFVAPIDGEALVTISDQNYSEADLHVTLDMVPTV